VLHKDDFIVDKVELTTFTPWNDVLIKVKSGIFMFFDIHANKLKYKHEIALSSDFILT